MYFSTPTNNYIQYIEFPSLKSLAYIKSTIFIQDANSYIDWFKTSEYDWDSFIYNSNLIEVIKYLLMKSKRNKSINTLRSLAAIHLFTSKIKFHPSIQSILSYEYFYYVIVRKNKRKSAKRRLYGDGIYLEPQDLLSRSGHGFAGNFYYTRFVYYAVEGRQHKIYVSIG